MSSNTLNATNRYGALPDTKFHLERFEGFGRPIRSGARSRTFEAVKSR